MPLALRPATPADVPVLASLVADGCRTYASFAGPGWAPPTAADEATHLGPLLGDDRVWCLVAEDDGVVVGQVTILPAPIAARPVDEPDLAHLRNLFVREDRWGSGVAGALHEAAVAEAARRGFAALRLFTPAAHGRARRFYEREGWTVAGEAFFDPVPDLVLVEYRRPAAEDRVSCSAR